jgi:hypothetical protein
LLPDLATFQRRFAATIDQPVGGAMAIYRNTVIHGAVEALAANYPVVAQIVGAEMFEGIALDFTFERPPHTPVLALYGDDFAEWIEQQLWTGDLPYLSDVARVERLHVEALAGADAEPLSSVDDAILATLRLKLHPAVRFSWLQTPAMSIWLAHQQSFRSTIEPEWKHEGALFARPTAFMMHKLRIGRPAHRLLFGIRLGETVGASLAAADALYPDADGKALFASLLNLGAFAAPHPERN